MQDDPHRDRLFEAEDTPLQQHRGLLWLSHGVVGFVALVAILNPQSLERWAAANPPSWGVETIRLTVGIWTERMQLAGLACMFFVGIGTTDVITNCVKYYVSETALQTISFIVFVQLVLQLTARILCTPNCILIDFPTVASCSFCSDRLDIFVQFFLIFAAPTMTKTIPPFTVQIKLGMPPTLE